MCPAPLASFSRLMSAFQTACSMADTRTRTATLLVSVRRPRHGAAVAGRDGLASGAAARPAADRRFWTRNRRGRLRARPDGKLEGVLAIDAGCRLSGLAEAEANRGEEELASELMEVFHAKGQFRFRSGCNPACNLVPRTTMACGGCVLPTVGHGNCKASHAPASPRSRLKAPWCSIAGGEVPGDKTYGRGDCLSVRLAQRVTLMVFGARGSASSSRLPG